MTSSAAGSAFPRSRSVTVVDSLLLDDCADADIRNPLGGYWGTFDDRWDGMGESVVWPKSILDGGVFEMSASGYRGVGYAARVSGRTGRKLGYDYVAIAMSLGPHADCPDPRPANIELSRYDGFRFMAKGQLLDGVLEFVLPHTKDGPAGNCTATKLAPDTLTQYSDLFVNISARVGKDWAPVYVAFTEFRQPDGVAPENGVDIGTALAHLKEINLLYKNPRGVEVDLWLDELELYRAEPHGSYTLAGAP